MELAQLDKIRQKSIEMRREVTKLREEVYEIKRLEWSQKEEVEKETARQMIMEQDMIYLNEWLSENK